MRDTDVFICGGGPAGLAAAIACRLHGFDVIVADCAKPPIDKACGEGLLPDALEALRTLGVVLDPEHAGVFRGIRFTDTQHSVEARFPADFAYGVRRTHLQQALQQRASALGADIWWNTQVLSMTPVNGGSAVQTSGQAVRARWTIGADGLQSRIRLWSGLDRGSLSGRRIGLRAHLRIPPGEQRDLVEVHWGESAQAYVTPISGDEIGVALVARDPRKLRTFEQGLHQFPALAARFKGAPRISRQRGSATLTRRLPRVCSGGVALIGDASGSIDAVTGAGLGLAFLQALALAPALKTSDLAGYQRAHREIGRRAGLMSHALLLMDRSASIRRLALRSLSRTPELFERMVAIHVGEAPLRLFGRSGALTLGLQLLRG
ncbi:MAG: FAD-dependent monooxygenase [Acidobacteriota bacterium]|nr:FAD-dependent monooxygenase [Acidobacteriota bacterium]